MTDGSHCLKGLLLATRPKTLWAGICPVAIGVTMAVRTGSYDTFLAIVCFLAAIFIQIGTNYANDYFDFKKGTDTEERIGPTRATQAGWVTPGQMLVATCITFALAAGCAIVVALNSEPPIGWYVAGILATSIVCGILYTAGPFPLGYNGLGDVFAFIFFGPVACGATYMIVAGTIWPPAFYVGIAPGAFSVAMIDVNNTRDIEQDRIAGKRTLAVLLGRKFAVVEYAGAILVAHIVPAWFYIYLRAAEHSVSLWVFLSFATLPLGIIGTYRLANHRDGATLNKLLAMTGGILLLHTILFCMGLLISP